MIDRYLAPHGINELLWSPADLSFGTDTLVQPDLFVADLDAFRHSGDWSDIQAPHLVIEVLSLSSVRADRFTKRRVYQQQRIPAYWIVDVEQRQVEVWIPDATFPVVEREQLLWRHPDIDAPCVVELTRIFEGIGPQRA